MDALRFGGLNIIKARVHALYKRFLFDFDSIQLLRIAAQTLGNFRLIAHEQKRAIRNGFHCESIYLTYKVVAEFTPARLICDAGVQKSIAKYNFSFGNCRQDHTAHMFHARGGEKQRFAFIGHALVFDAQHHISDAFGDGGAARFARGYDVIAARAQIFRRQAHLRAFAAAIRTFVGDEPAAFALSGFNEHIGKLRNRHGDVLRARVFQFLARAEAIARADGVQPHFASGFDIEEPVADHYRGIGIICIGQRALNQRAFIGGFAFHGDAHQRIEITIKAEVFGDLANEDFRLAAGDGDVRAPPLQRAQQRRDAFVHAVFLPADGGIAFAVEVRGADRIFLGHAGVHFECGDQRRAYEAFQYRLLRHASAHFFKRVGDAFRDALAVIINRSVQIEQQRIVSHSAQYLIIYSRNISPLHIVSVQI